MPEECIQEKLIEKIQHDLNRNCKAIKTRVPWVVFTLVLGALFILATGGYQYTHSTDKKIRENLEKHRSSCETNGRKIDILDAERHLSDYKYKKIDEKLQDILDITTQNLEHSQDNEKEIQKLKWKIGSE